jgi:hypothetical protein
MDRIPNTRSQCIGAALLLGFTIAMPNGGVQAQDDLETLSLQVSKAEAANLDQLKAFIWKRRSDTYVRCSRPPWWWNASSTRRASWW